MRKFYLLFLFTAISFLTHAQVTVTATAGNTGPASYTTLKTALDSINSGFHKGVINISLTANTTETATAALNASGSGNAVYTSVNISATTPVTVTGSIVGAIIKLNGADNVTIDGRIGGTGRNITVSNTSTAAATAAIWLSSTGAGAGATNNTIRNLELACGATQNTGTNSTFGIIQCGATISTTSDGLDNDNNTYTDNRIIRCRYGIVTRGAIANLNQNITITNNIVGPTSFGTDQIGKNGIFLQADSAVLVSGNTVQFVGGDFANTTSGGDRFGIAIGSEAWASTPSTLAGQRYTVIKNIVHDVIEERTFSAIGINVSATNALGTNNLVANNFIYNVKANGTAGDAGVGIGIGAGNGDFIIFNSVRMEGDLDPNASASTPSQTNACLRVAGTPTNLTIRNNILYNNLFSSSATTLNTVCIIVPSASFAWGTGGLDNNDYYYPASNTVARTGAIGTTSLATTFFTTLANWQAALSPARDGSSKAVDPAFTSATDLHIPAATASQLESAGVAAGGVTTDIDNDTRPGPAGSVNGGGTAPDIGADEFDGIPVDLSAPAISYTALAFTCATGDRTLSNVTITDPSGVPTSGVLVPRVYYRKNAGTWFSQPGTLTSGSATNGVWSFTIVAADMGGLTGGDVVQYYVIAQDNAGTPNIGSNPAGVVATNVNTVTTHPTTPNSYNVSSPLGGTYTVGAAQTYTTLTAAIAAYNTSCLSGPVIFELTDATYNEAGAMTILQNPDASATNTLTIKPSSGVNASVSATAASAAVLKIAGNYVIIDGSNNGTKSRNLTFTNNSATSPSVLAIVSSGSTPVTSVTVKNCIAINGVNTSSAVIVSDGTTLGNAGYFTNITVQNNDIQKAYIGIYSIAVVQAGNGSGLLIENNVLNTSGANAIRYTGIYVQGADGATVRLNDIGNFETTTSEADRAIWFATSTTNSVIERNNIHDMLYTGTSGYGAKGIVVSTGLAAANVTVKNNMISRITGDADTYATFGCTFAPTGIYVFGTGQGGVNIYHNTVYLYGNTLNFSSGSYSIGIGLDDGAAAIVKNNIIHNSLGRLGATGAGSAGIALELSAAQLLAGSDYNNFYMAGTGGGGNFFGKIAGTDYSTLATWQAASGRDANSKNILPVYIGAPDLHLDPASNTALNDVGNPVASVTNDYDNDTRSATTPDMGADEFAPPPCTAVAGTAVASPAGPFCSPGATTISLSGTGTGTGISYQWQTSPDNSVWTDSTGQTGASLNVSGLTASRYYRCMVTCSATSTSNPSTSVQIVITQGPTATVTPPGPLYLCAPISQLLTSATNAATPAYQWKLGGGNIAGATSATYTATASGSYTVTVTDGATTCSTTSAAVIVNIDPPPTVPVITPASSTICKGDGPIAVSITSGGQIASQYAFGTQAVQNTASTTAAGYPAPYTVYYGGQRMQMLIRASELSAAGYAAGSQFTDIQFPVVSLGANWGGTLTSCQSFQVSIGATALTTITAFQTGLTQVVTPANFTPVVGYTNTHTFSTPFTWDGASNIIIETTFSNNITGGTADLVTQYNSPTGYQSCIVYRADGVTAAAAATATSINFSYSSRPDFKLNGSKPGNFIWSPTTGLYTDAAGTIPYTGLAATTVYANPTTTTTYTATSCTTTGTSTINITPPSNSNGLAGTAGGGPVCVSQTVAAGGTRYFDGSCNLIAKITPSGAPAVSGTVNACVTIDAAVQVDADGHPYVQRHYDIEPAAGAATAQGINKLYFTQPEFDAYNTYVTANSLPFPLLPTGGVDNGMVRITQFHGTGTAPGNYTGATEFITPATVVWNATENWWEVTFPVIGYSGFYLHTGPRALLPVSQLSIGARITGASNTVNWTTVTEEGNRKFVVERSIDSRNYTAIGEVNSLAPGGNSSTPLNYRFEDLRPVNGKQYYRLRLVSLTGSEKLSPVVSLNRSENGLQFVSVRPNPTPGQVYINITGARENVTLILRNAEGKEVLRSAVMPGVEKMLNIASQPAGVYMLEALENGSGLKAVYKIVKY